MKVADLQKLLQELLPAHATAFVQGDHPYADHPLFIELREMYSFDAAHLVKKTDGKIILAKAQACYRKIRNEIMPLLYKCTGSIELHAGLYLLRSGKQGSDLLLELKKKLWEAKGRPADAFQPRLAWNNYHSYLLPGLVLTVASDYIYDVPGLQYFKHLIQPASVGTDNHNAHRGKGRAQQRKEEQKRKK